MDLEQHSQIAGEKSLLISSTEDGLVLQDAAGRVVFANPAAARLLGLDSPEQMRGRTWPELMARLQFPEGGEGGTAGGPPAGWLSGEGAEQRTLELRYRLGTGEERWTMVSATPLPDAGGRPRQGLLLLRDLTAERRAARALRFLSEASTMLAASLDPDETLQAIGRLVVPELADWCCVDLLEEDGSFRLAMGQHVDPARAQAGYELRRLYPPRPEAGVGAVIRTGKPVFAPRVSMEVLRAAAVDERHLQLMLELGMYGTIMVPLIARGRTLGGLTLTSAESRRRFEPADLSLATELANRAAVALDNARLLRKAREAEVRSRRTEERLGLALEAGRMGYFDVSIPTGRISMSPGLEVILGLSSVPEAGHSYAAQPTLERVVHPEELRRVTSEIQPVVRGERDDFHLETRLAPAAGQVRWIQSFGRVLRDEQGRPTWILGVIVDVTERRSAEEARAVHEAELERSNAELERFAYVASHDLQEPLRMVASFTQLLARRYQGQLDAEADEFIAYVVEGVRRMKTQLEDLLTYSRVDLRGDPFVPISLEKVLRLALERLRSAIEESGAEISCDPLPEVEGDPRQLELLLLNLLDNAIKFRARGIAPRVRVAVAPDEGGWRFSVRDNGIGIEPRYFERIFVIFRRLHDRRDYPGTGVGLAVCRKIVERHGGQIGVESAPGQGSTFWFTLPARRDAGGRGRLSV